MDLSPPAPLSVDHFRLFLDPTPFSFWSKETKLTSSWRWGVGIHRVFLLRRYAAEDRRLSVLSNLALYLVPPTRCDVMLLFFAYLCTHFVFQLLLLWLLQFCYFRFRFSEISHVNALTRAKLIFTPRKKRSIFDFEIAFSFVLLVAIRVSWIAPRNKMRNVSFRCRAFLNE